MKFRGVLKSVTQAGGPMSVTSLPATGPRDVCVCILGVGYVGESLLAQFGNVVNAIGYDISEARVSALRQKYLDNARIRVTADPSELTKGTHFLIAVPTSLRDDNSINLDYVISALNTIVTFAKPGSCIVIESSVAVGCFRTDPKSNETLVPVSKPEVAEMTKLYENCYRMVNIAYVNEISDACVSHGIDPHEMIGAAATKPFGFQPFFPGLGVGGHCIPINPWYLFENNKGLKVLKTATKLMQSRPGKHARRFHRACQGKPFSKTNISAHNEEPRILVVGLGFKNGQVNLACSPALSFARTAQDLGCSRLAFYDPTISAGQVQWMEKLDEACWNAEYIESEFDGVVLCNKVEVIDTTLLEKLHKPLVKLYT